MPYKDPVKQKQAIKENYHRQKDLWYERTKRRREYRRKWFSDLLDELSCLICDENANEVIDLHHVDPDVKHDNVSKMLFELRSMKSVVEEIQKCVPLCSNCHRKYHRGTITRNFHAEECVVVPLHLIDCDNC